MTVDSRQYVVDGDNVIGSWGGPRDGDPRRDEVVRRVDAVCRRLGARAMVVFDPAVAAVEATESVSVRIAPNGRTADDLIREIVDGAPEVSALTVVSSDKPLYSYARTRGAAVLRVHEWRALERGEESGSRA